MKIELQLLSLSCCIVVVCPHNGRFTTCVALFTLVLSTSKFSKILTPTSKFNLTQLAGVTKLHRPFFNAVKKADAVTNVKTACDVQLQRVQDPLAEAFDPPRGGASRIRSSTKSKSLPLSWISWRWRLNPLGLPWANQRWRCPSPSLGALESKVGPTRSWAHKRGRLTPLA